MYSTIAYMDIRMFMLFLLPALISIADAAPLFMIVFIYHIFSVAFFLLLSYLPYLAYNEQPFLPRIYWESQLVTDRVIL